MSAILIVEDDRHQRLLLEEELQGEGHTTRAAATAREALDAVSRAMPDLIVLDIGMPGMDGVQFLRKLLARNCLLPIVIHTAYAGYQDSFLSWAVDAYVMKRSDLTELKDTIRRLLGGRRGPDPLPPSGFACVA